MNILATYDASQAGQLTPFVQPLDTLGKPATDPSILTGTDAAGSGTSLAWTGDRFGISWADRRDGNYEIYFALLDPTGKKMAPGDERITISKGFSIYPSLVWTGQQFVVVWQEEKSSGDFKLQGQRLDLDGRLIGDIATLTTGSADEQGPTLASGKTELGLVWVHRTTTSQSISFQPFNFDLTGITASPQPVTLTKPAMTAAAPLVAYDKKNDRYVASFYDAAPTGRTVYGAVVAKDATVVVPATNIAQSTAQSRDPSLLALGDRVLFVYADNRDGNQGYELYAHTLSADLSLDISRRPASRTRPATASRRSSRSRPTAPCSSSSATTAARRRRYSRRACSASCRRESTGFLANSRAFARPVEVTVEFPNDNPDALGARGSRSPEPMAVAVAVDNDWR